MRADDVGRQHVRRELNALELRLNGGSESLERKRFRQTRDAFEQDMAVADQPDHEPVDQMFLADNDASHLLPQWLHPRGRLLHGFVDRLHARVRAGRSRHRRRDWVRCNRVVFQIIAIRRNRD